MCKLIKICHRLQLIAKEASGGFFHNFYKKRYLVVVARCLCFTVTVTILNYHFLYPADTFLFLQPQHNKKKQCLKNSSCLEKEGVP